MIYQFNISFKPFKLEVRKLLTHRWAKKRAEKRPKPTETTKGTDNDTQQTA